MTSINPQDEQAVLAHIQALAVAGAIAISDHADQMFAERDITTAEAREALAAPQLLENYPIYAKGPAVWCMAAVRLADQSTSFVQPHWPAW